jgi:hypothetical protein
MFLSLTQTDWLGIIAGLLLVIALLIVWLIGRGGGRQPINLIDQRGSIGASANVNQSKHVKQDDHSQRQTAINTNVNVNSKNRNASSKSNRQPSSGNSDDNSGIFIVAGIALLTVCALYVKHFEMIKLVTRATYLGVVVFCFFAWVVSIFQRDSLDNDQQFGFVAPFVGALVGVWLLLQAQDVISPEVVQAAQAVPNSIAGFIDFYLNKLSTYGKRIVLISASASLILMLHAMIAALTALRTFVVCYFYDEEESGYGVISRIFLRYAGAFSWEKYAVLALIFLIGSYALMNWVPLPGINSL